jgi:hypothetical protein
MQKTAKRRRSEQASDRRQPALLLPLTGDRKRNQPPSADWAVSRIKEAIELELTLLTLRAGSNPSPSSEESGVNSLMCGRARTSLTRSGPITDYAEFVELVNQFGDTTHRTLE